MRVRTKVPATLALVVAIAATGCGFGDHQGSESPASTSPTSTTPTPTASSPTGQPPKTVPTTTPAAAEISAEDKQSLLAVLGPAATAQLCKPAESNRVECGKMFAAAGRLVAQLQASVKQMPKTKPYRTFAGELALFQHSYSTSKNLGCFGAKTPRNPDICESITSLGALTYLTVTTILLY